MGIFHFLNVKQGDCSIIQHPSERVTVIDVCNAFAPSDELRALDELLEKTRGNFRQKDQPVNPIEYLKKLGINSVFRFILTHPDMDHMDGIKAFFAEFSPENFWDTDNAKEIDFNDNSPFNEQDWLFYKSLRDRKPTTNPKRLTLYSGTRGAYYNKAPSGEVQDGLFILAPTSELVASANDSGDHNDSSYVILYRSAGGKILIAGDSHDNTWDHALEHHADDIKDVDVLIAPHHGRDSGRSFDFLDYVNPALTLFGNANSEHLAYGAWQTRGLPIITNNQASCVVIDTNSSPMSVYVTNEAYAKKENASASYNATFGGYFLKHVERPSQTRKARRIFI